MKIFHMNAAGHAKKNKIKRLRGDDGTVVTDRSKMEDMARVFF
jgi:hypothetical protein